MSAELLKAFCFEFSNTYGVQMEGEYVLDLPLSLMYKMIDLACDTKLDTQMKFAIFRMVMRNKRGEMSNKERVVYDEALKIARMERADKLARIERDRAEREERAKEVA